MVVALAQAGREEGVQAEAVPREMEMETWATVARAEEPATEAPP